MAVQSPPPNITETIVDAWAHCRNARCPGYGQQPVQAVKQLVEWTGLALGAGGPGSTALAQIVDRSTEYLQFANNGLDENDQPDPDASNDVPCPSCGKDREVSLQERPVYAAITGFPQDGLLGAPAFDPGVRNTKADEAAAAREAEQSLRMAALEEQITKLTAALGGD